ncbi:MAG: hypothetical protein WCP20_14000 [Desulfuromonadales bacterium]
MNIDEINQTAGLQNLRLDRVTNAELVCAIQQAEGEQPCFGSNTAGTCEQHTCIWREYCA